MCNRLQPGRGSTYAVGVAGVLLIVQPGCRGAKGEKGALRFRSALNAVQLLCNLFVVLRGYIGSGSAYFWEVYGGRWGRGILIDNTHLPRPRLKTPIYRHFRACRELLTQMLCNFFATLSANISLIWADLDSMSLLVRSVYMACVVAGLTWPTILQTTITSMPLRQHSVI